MKFIFKISFLLIVASVLILSTYAQWDDMKPITGAKMYFSSTPFTAGHEGSKTTFTSADFIYARLELNKQTLSEAFNISSNKTGRHYLRYRVSTFKNGEQKESYNLWDYLLLKPEIEKNTWLNFDIFPEPAKATSVLCGTETFNSNVAAAPLYHIITREHFPENGEYTIKVRLFLESYDAWDKKEDPEKWPVADGEFTFQFDPKDVKAIRKNATAANEVITNTAFLLKKLPEYFYKSANVNDSELTPAKIVAILKRDLSDRVILKFSVASYSGLLWQVESDAGGVIKYKYATPGIHIAYKWNEKCYLGTATLWKDYEGSGKYGSLKVGWSTCNSCGDLIECGLIK
jgi:hypothetical protein